MRSATFSFALTGFLASTAVSTPTPSAFDTQNYKSSDIITRDVAIVGGGSGGTYSTVALKDAGKSTILIEQKNRIGGHAETYIAPDGTPIDMGVIIFHNNSIVRDYFARFNIPLGQGVDFFRGLEYYDFRSGKKVVPSHNDSDTTATTNAFAAYSKARDQWPALINGAFLPNPVPADLYGPFGDFVKKYNIQAAVPTLYNYQPGVGSGYTNIPTIEVFRYWGADMASFQFISTTHHNTSELYSNAQAELLAGNNLLLNSQVISSSRSNSGVKLVVKTPSGNKLILAKKLIVAIPPKTDILAPFDLDSQEKNVFGKWKNGGYWVGIIKNTGLDDAIEYTNSINGTEYNFAPLPNVYSFAPSGTKGLHMTTVGSELGSASQPFTEDQVRSYYTKAVKALQASNPNINATGEPELVDLRNHSPYNLQVSNDDVKNGFYDKLYALQGLRSTYYTGAAWLSEDSSRIWKYTKEQMLPELLKGL